MSIAFAQQLKELRIRQNEYDQRLSALEAQLRDSTRADTKKSTKASTTSPAGQGEAGKDERRTVALSDRLSGAAG
jgi:hypothetical protein